MAYPNSLDSFSTKTDGIDDVMAADINSIQSAIESVETELGTLPKGNFASLVARLNAGDTELGVNPKGSYADVKARLDYIETHSGNVDLGAAIHAATEKTVPVDADEVGIWDSVAGLFKKLTWANIKATLKTYFDALYTSITGWNPANASWTYVSSTSFTTPGDQTAKYRIGTKIKCTIGGVVKYNVVYSSSYAASVTTVNVKGNDLASGTISENYFSLIEMPDGFPDVFAYTMTRTGFTVNTDTSYFSLSGRRLSLMIFTQGTSNANTQTLGLPFQVHLATGVSAPARGLDNGAWLAAPSMADLAQGDPTAITMCKVFDGASATWTTTNTKGAVVNLTLLIG